MTPLLRTCVVRSDVCHHDRPVHQDIADGDRRGS
jgi:hypothetical protein